MLLSVLVSVSISVAIFAVLLLFTRQRLARQFEDIQRRLLESERLFAAIKAAASRFDIERGAIAEQLSRVQLGLVRTQENAAARHDLLVPAAKRSLTDLQILTLEKWALELGALLDAAQIARLLRAVERAEFLALEHAAIETKDLLARLIALLSQPARDVSCVLAGASAKSWVPLLAHLAPGVFDRIEVLELSDGAPDVSAPASRHALVLDAAATVEESTLAGVKFGGVLVLQDAPGAERGVRNFTGFKLIAGEWDTRVYRKG